MSGHSHWATIRRSKAANDAKRGRLWSKLARRIIVAAKSGGGKPDENLQLRYAIDDAKSANLPKDTIENAIKKGTGELGAENYDRIFYEGYGPGGVAILMEVMTDNKNRTVAEVRHILSKRGGNLGETGCVNWMFSQKGLISISKKRISEEDLMSLALEGGAEDIQTDDKEFYRFCREHEK